MSEYARMDLPVRVFSRNQKSSSTSTTATATLSVWVVLIASPSDSPVQSLKSRTVNRKRAPSVKTRSAGPMTKRMTPFRTNMTPTDTTSRITGCVRVRRWNRKTQRSVARHRPAVTAIPTGNASSAVGRDPRPTPQDCSHQVNRMVTMAPNDMVSPWAKLEKRRTPYTSVTPSAPRASWQP